MGGTILVADHGSWAEVTLNRPDRLNSFTEAMHGELAAALDGLRPRALLLTGAGRGFCAGQDLSDRDPDAPGAAPRDLGETLERFYNPLVRRLREAPYPVVCAVNGVAAGAGANLALACDVVLAARSARFVQSFAKVGLIPDAGGTWTLARRLGEARAKGLALLAEPLDAETARDWGLIWGVAEDAALMEEARALAARLAEGPTRALAEAKRAIHAAGTQGFEEQLALEAEIQRACGATEDYREGVRAFLQRRPPRFTGGAG
jgi:2-(1,2-epoxy-1,2-dihydrophenyl)acetyl-CoA isomerase